jgi:hypothetical protein
VFVPLFPRAYRILILQRGLAQRVSLSWQRLGLARYVGTVFVSCGVLEWAALAAVLPDRVLDEPGKGLWKAWIELPSIDPFSDSSNFAGSVIVCSAMM